MAKQDNNRGTTGRENTEVDKAFRQVSGSGKRPTARQIAERKKAARNRKIAIISVCSVILVVLIGLIIGMIVYAGRDTDDGRILDNVCAGGVNLGGMTVEEAKNALHLATDNTFSKKDLVVKLPDASIKLSPADTGAKLDVDAVVQAAYDYGRTGTDAENKKAHQSASTTIHTIALLPYLDLDLRYIQRTIDEFCSSYSSSMTQPSVMLRGDRPAYDPEYPDLSGPHQTMVITIGIPDYTLNADKVYDRVLDAYSLNELEITYKAPQQMEPLKLNAQELFDEHCLKPEDATLDDETFEVTPEVYGYGFDVDAVQKLIDSADYGQTLEIKLGFIAPDITAKDLTENLFQDLLATYTCTLNDATEGWINNLKVACEAISGTVLKEDEDFSFNRLLGRPSTGKGYMKAPGYRSGLETDILGAGIEQVASTLYYCVLMSDLGLQERHNNGYVVEYAELGLDVCISWGSQDLRFVNDTDAPIRIVAEANGGSVTVRIFGTDNRKYDITLKTDIINTYEPETIYQVMDKDNFSNYTDGQILVSGITGYDVEVYKIKLHKQTGNEVSKTLIDTSNYNKRDQKEVQIESDPIVEPDPSEPSEPVEDPGLVDDIASLLDQII